MPDSHTLVVRFENSEKRENFRDLCKQLGYNEDELAQRLLQNFITYCQEKKNEQRRLTS